MKKNSICLIISLLALNSMAQNHIIVNNASSSTILGGFAADHISNSSSYKNNFSLGKDALKSNLNGVENTAIGINALQNLNGYTITGNGVSYRFANGNTALGYLALSTDVHSGVNVAIGAYAMKSHFGSYTGASSYRTTVGSGNVAVGGFAMADGSAGSLNVAIGMNALRKNVGKGNGGYVNTPSEYQGSENVTVGSSSMYENTIGRYNVAIGANSLMKNTTTSENVAIGFEALHELIDAGFPPTTLPYSTYPAKNIAIGFQAGYNELGHNKLYIENSNSATPLIGGDFTNDIVGINRNVSLLAGFPSDKLQVGGNTRVFGNLYVSGSVYATVGTFSGNITLVDGHYKMIYIGGGLHVVTLPSPIMQTGREYLIINHGGGSLQTSMTFKTGLASTDQYILPGNALHLISDGNDWVKIN